VRKTRHLLKELGSFCARLSVTAANYLPGIKISEILYSSGIISMKLDKGND